MLYQSCRHCHLVFVSSRRRLRPICGICVALPDPIPSWPPRWPFAVDPEPEWLRVFLAPGLVGELPRLPDLSDPVNPEPELPRICRCCGEPFPKPQGRGWHMVRRCETCRAVSLPPPPPEGATFLEGRTCIDCAAALPDPTRPGKPPKRCPACRAARVQPRKVISPSPPPQPAPPPDYADLASLAAPYAAAAVDALALTPPYRPA